MLNKKYYKQILLPVFSVASILLLLATIIGCSKEMETADTLEVSKENPVVKADGGSISIDVSSNTSWKVGKIESSWLRIENTAGTGDGQLRLSYDENDAVHTRTAEFFIVTVNDGKYHKIKLTQLASDP